MTVGASGSVSSPVAELADELYPEDSPGAGGGGGGGGGGAAVAVPGASGCVVNRSAAAPRRTRSVRRPGARSAATASAKGASDSERPLHCKSWSPGRSPAAAAAPPSVANCTNRPGRHSGPRHTLHAFRQKVLTQCHSIVSQQQLLKQFPTRIHLPPPWK